MSDSPIKFGTDGWRAVVAEDFTFDNVRICAQAVANFLADVNMNLEIVTWLIGFDNYLEFS